jgi:flagellar biosynthesis protein FlhF
VKILKFEGATMRDAIARVKAELGDHAVIVSTRPIRRGLLGSGVEISAAIDNDDGTDAGRDRDNDDNIGPRHGGPMSRSYAAASAQPPAAPAATGPDVEKLLAPLRSEIRSLRALVRAELRPPVKPTPPATSQVQTLAPRAATVRADALVAPSLGHALALVGPTGAGKTTTIAKLAARAALIERRAVQLVTLDDYRVGGIDQIRTFAELIGVPLHTVPSIATLRALVADTATLTLIDTAGRSPRDAGAIAELADVLHAVGGPEVHLVAPAATTAGALDALAQRYRVVSPARLLVTKLDEVDAAPDLARAPGRLGLPITWVTTGQAVPEDIEEPTAARIAELAARALQTGRAA